MLAERQSVEVSKSQSVRAKTEESMVCSLKSDTLSYKPRSISLKLITHYSLLITCYLLLILPTAAIAFCFEEAGRAYDINQSLLKSIAKTESNFTPDALHRNNDGTYDIGLMQINSSWIKTLNLNADLLLSDPCYNLKTGANILRMCIDKYGYAWEAIGCYNAVSINKKIKYSWKIFKELVASKELKVTSYKSKGEEIPAKELEAQ